MSVIEEGFIVEPPLESEMLTLIGQRLPNLQKLEPTYIVGNAYTLAEIHKVILDVIGTDSEKYSISYSQLLDIPPI